MRPLRRRPSDTLLGEDRRNVVRPDRASWVAIPAPHPNLRPTTKQNTGSGGKGARNDGSSPPQESDPRHPSEPVSTRVGAGGLTPHSQLRQPARQDLLQRPGIGRRGRDLPTGRADLARARAVRSDHDRHLD